MRTIPHSTEMEEAVIGSMMLNRQAREHALDQLALDDFHVPLHRTIFGAISTLVQAGAAVDPPLVASTSGLDSHAVSAIIAVVPASMAWKNYVGVVAELGAFRRAIALADELANAAYERDADTLDQILADPIARVLPHHEPVTTPTEASVLAEEQYEPDYVLPGLLARLEVSMVVGEPGYGKSTLLRQIGVCGASGLHPFTRVRIPPVKVLIVDCQESRGQAGMEIRKLLSAAGDRYRHQLWIEPVPQGIDLSTPRHQRWLDAKVKSVNADLVILGPLYNMIRGGAGRAKHSEETAELGMNALSDLMVSRNCALMVEAHAPHGNEMRVRGSKLWEDWPDFGHGLIPDSSARPKRALDLDKFRGDRHYRPDWPKRYVEGSGPWPWEAGESRAIA